MFAKYNTELISSFWDNFIDYLRYFIYVKTKKIDFISIKNSTLTMIQTIQLKGLNKDLVNS